MPRGKPGTGPNAGRGSQTRTVKYNESYIRYSKPKHPGFGKGEAKGPKKGK